jgi:hypothetical protein
MHATARAALVGLMFSAPALAPAQTLWLCGLSDDAVRLVGVADADPLQPAEATPKPTAAVNGTQFPLDPRRQWSVDLWSPPTEMAFVAELARATICYRSPGCTVVMGGDRQLALAPMRH